LVGLISDRYPSYVYCITSGGVTIQRDVKGTDVIPKHDVQGMGGVTVNIYGNVDMSSDQNIDDVAARLGRQLNAARAGSF